MATQKHIDSSYTNGRVDLALQAFKEGHFTTLQAAARSYDIPITTLRRRAVGTPQKRASRALNRKLSYTEEVLAFAALGSGGKNLSISEGLFYVRTKGKPFIQTY
jgi:hypothetical protein